MTQKSPPTWTQEYHVAGMDCASCALTLERSLSGMEGMQSVRVNFATASLQISGTVSRDALRQRVAALGYQLLEDPDIMPTPLGTPHARTGLRGVLAYVATNRTAALALGGAVILASAGLLDTLTSLPDAAFAILHLLVLAFAGYTIALRGLRGLVVGRQITIDLLMTLAAAGAVLIGETGEAATVMVLFGIGEALEGYTADRARDSLRSLIALAPDRAVILRSCMDCAEHLGQNGYTGGVCPFCEAHETVVPIAEVKAGETAIVRPGERIPVDGQITAGSSWVNQAPITGESTSVFRQVGDTVFAGTINGRSALEILVTRAAADSTISRIVRLVAQAQERRSPTERLVDRFARWYTPAVVVTAILVAVAPPLIFGGPFFDAPDGTRGWLYRALALLIVACPCALVISTPVTIVSALTALARRGVLIKGGEFLDTLARVRTFAFDKTGTLTVGQPAVVQVRGATCVPDVQPCSECDDMLALAAAVERRSEHPLGRAVIDAAAARGLTHRYAAAEAVESLAGHGVQGFVAGTRVIVGSHPFFHGQGRECHDLHSSLADAESDGQTVMLVARDDRVLGFVSTADRIRPGSAAALGALKAMGSDIRTVMLTGDNETAARAVAAQLGTADEIRAGLLPEDKVEAIKALKQRDGVVAMVGDGINDAPALATASVGIAMGGEGTAQAMETADVVLMQDNLTQLPDVVETSRRALQIIRQNIAFSLAIKAVFLLLTLPGWATLWMAVFADMGASLIVTFNGMRMLRAREASPDAAAS